MDGSFSKKKAKQSSADEAPQLPGVEAKSASNHT
jgi:hypothetical protein